jgi:hypothetical protein
MQTHSTQRAATKLGRSQSYVSKVLAQLREELDDQLFLRSADGLAPTEYAIAIEPKVKAALEQVKLAIEPEVFSPKSIDKITLHIIEPYLIACGKEIIKTIRQHTQAPIEILQWNKTSESLILEEEVDVGVHALNDKPQTFYQRRIHRGTGQLHGNLDGEFVKYVVAGVNDHSDLFKLIDPNLTATIFTDNHALMVQMLDECCTIRYSPEAIQAEPGIALDLALIVKASRRSSGKIKWLMELLLPILDKYKPLSYS